MFRIIKIIAAALVNLMVLFSCTVSESESSAELMYFILLDRFVDGDSTNNEGHTPESYLRYDGHNPEALKHYQGGDLIGVTQSLDSLKALGMTMIWISPFLDNSNTDYVGWWPYHGYHPIDFYAVDEHYGSIQDLKTLVHETHVRGMKIIFDMPFNQTAADHPWIGDESKENWFHVDEQGQPYAITDWQDQEQIERGELHGLPDLAQENPAVSDYIIEVSKFWIEQTGCDGFRLDAVKHIPLRFWKYYNQEIRAYAGTDFLLLGEVFWGSAEKIAPYADVGFDYLFDIPGYYAIRNTFNKGAGLADFSDFFIRNAELLPNTPLATLIDNHDVARFNVGLQEKAWDKQLLALGWLMTAPGLPVIYSGTELGMQGYPATDAEGNSQDYLNRLPYPEVLGTQQALMKSQFQKLTRLRHQYNSLSMGIFKELYKDWSVYAYLRSWENEHVLVCLNTAETQEFVSTPLPPGLAVDDLEQVYGSAVLRLEVDAILFRLPPHSLSVWSFQGSVPTALTDRVSFTDRLSADYQIVRLYHIDTKRKTRVLQVAGDFNNWSPRGYETHRSGDTLFTNVPVKPGTYAYKFILDESEWIPDANAAEFSIDPYGGQNSILTVNAEAPNNIK